MFDPRPETSAAVEVISATFGNNPHSVAIVLGSGLGAVFESGTVLAETAYKDVPGLPQPKVEGHSGVLRLVELEGFTCLCFCGRSHLYESYPPHRLGMSVRIAAALGANTLVTTSAVGSLRKEYRPGRMVVVTDHINLTGTNPLIGVAFDNSNEKFIDTRGMYTARLRENALVIGKKEKLDIDTGVYAWVTGPSFETPAESRMIRQFGADVIGMSMIPETITARQLGMRILAIACVTNYAPGIGNDTVSHQDVLGRAGLFSTPLKKLLSGMRNFLQT